jgi:hypothetical protein
VTVHLRKHVRAILAEAIAAAEPVGVSVRLEDGGRHPKLVLEGNGTKRIRPIAANDGDDAIRWARRDVRRLLEEMAS